MRDTIPIMPKITYTKCPHCKGTGEIDDPIWIKKKCPIWNCENGLIKKEEKTLEELDKEFKDEQDALSAQSKL